MRRGIKVRCLVRPSRNNLRWISHLPIERISGDLLSPQSLESAIKDVDYVIHIAGVTKAKRRNDYYKGNVTTTRNLLDISTRLKNLKKFCYVSSLTAAGPSPDGKPLDEQSVCKPITSYGRSKLDAEQECAIYRSFFPIVVLRPPSIYGPRDKDVLELFRAAKFGLQPSVGSKIKTMSVIYGLDMARAIVESTISEKTVNKTYFVSDPKVYQLSRLFDILAELMGSRSFRLRLPARLVYSTAAVTEFISLFGSNPALLSIEKARDMVQDHWVCNPDAIRRDIGFETITNAEEGLKQTYLWYRANGWI